MISTTATHPTLSGVVMLLSLMVETIVQIRAPK